MGYGRLPGLSATRIGLSITAAFWLTATVLGIASDAGKNGGAARNGPNSTSSPPLGTQSQSHTANARSSPPAVEKHFREGSVTEQTGAFKTAGDRIVFSSLDGKITMVCLENLNLERIARAITDSADTLEWRVSGTLTEYSGSNYLLVERAILRSRADSRENR